MLRSRTATESERNFFVSRFPIALLHNLAVKPEHPNAPIIISPILVTLVTDDSFRLWIQAEKLTKSIGGAGWSCNQQSPSLRALGSVAEWGPGKCLANIKCSNSLPALMCSLALFGLSKLNSPALILSGQLKSGYATVDD